MPLRIAPYQQQTTPAMGGAPRASAPGLIDQTGAALTSLAKELQDFGRERYTAQRDADLQDRIGKATSELATLELEFERDQDFRTSPQRFQERADAIRDKYLEGVSDQAVATAFRKRYAEFSLAKSLNVRRAAHAKEKDYSVASLDSSIDVYATQAANAKNPAERELVLNQARIAIATAQTGGYITDVDAGKRERTLLGKIDEATVLRDMSLDPSITADKLALDPSYAGNLDPVQRQRWSDQAYRRADTERRRQEAEAERERKRRGDELAKEAYSRLEGRKLTREYVEEIRHFIEPGEYKSLLKSLHEGPTQKNDPRAYADLLGKVYDNPAEAERLAFQYHKAGLIKNETLSSVLGTARTVGRQEGPRSAYERERQYITNALTPSEASSDPAPRARLGIAIREFDDFAKAGNRSDAELRAAADDILKRTYLVDMTELARRTAVGSHPTPTATLDGIASEAARLQADLDAKRISKANFDKRMKQLNDTRKAAEKAEGANGRK
jgi:hypothetical protein